MNQPTTNPTYEEKLQKLRDTGVIDMELSFGCLMIRKGGLHHLIDEYVGHYHTREYVVDCEDTWYNSGNWSDKDNFKILGHDLTYGRACWWIENNKRGRKYCYCCESCLEDIDFYEDSENYDYCYKCRDRGCVCSIESKFSSLRHQKHLPLSQQENKLEMVDFIYNLIQ